MPFLSPAKCVSKHALNGFTAAPNSTFHCDVNILWFLSVAFCQDTVIPPD